MDAKTQLLALLASHEPADEKERSDVDRMVEFARSLANPLSRSELEAHFTGSAVVVHPTKPEVCLVFHGKYRRWIQLGGHGEIEDAGDISATALREAREESGLEAEHFKGAPCLIDVDIHVIPERGEVPEHLHLDMRFLIQAKNEHLLSPSNESGNVAWFSWDEAIRLLEGDPSGQRMLKKARDIACVQRS